MLLSKRKTNPLMRSFFSDFFDSDSFFENEWFKQEVPSVNIKETDQNYHVELAAPGLKKEDFDISIENGMLNISSESKTEKEEEEENYTRKEFSYSSFKRSFRLPENVSEDDIQASYEDGLLRINLLKTSEEETRPKRTISVD